MTRKDRLVAVEHLECDLRVMKVFVAAIEQQLAALKASIETTPAVPASPPGQKLPVGFPRECEFGRID